MYFPILNWILLFKSSDSAFVSESVWVGDGFDFSLESSTSQGLEVLLDGLVLERLGEGAVSGREVEGDSALGEWRRVWGEFVSVELDVSKGGRALWRGLRAAEHLGIII